MEGDLNFQPSLSRYAKPNLKQPRHYREGASLASSNPPLDSGSEAGMTATALWPAGRGQVDRVFGEVLEYITPRPTSPHEAVAWIEGIGT